MTEYPPTKRCSKCREELPRAEFYKNKGRPDGIQTVCKSCTRTLNRERDRAHPDWWRKYGHKDLSAEQKVSRDARARQWKLDNPEREQELRKARDSNRRARRYGVPAEHISQLVVLERDDGVCGICGEDIDPLSFELDHIVPFARGGHHTYANVQLAHLSCNRKKHQRLPIEMVSVDPSNSPPPGVIGR